jgi:hypothetical protein
MVFIMSNDVCAIVGGQNGALGGGWDVSLSVQFAITKLELKVGLVKVKNSFGVYVWKVGKYF